MGQGVCTASGVDDKGAWKCDSDAICRGLCKSHYVQIRRAPDKPFRRIKVRARVVSCSASGSDSDGAWSCNQTAYSRTLCRAHYAQVVVRGNMPRRVGVWNQPSTVPLWLRRTLRRYSLSLVEYRSIAGDGSKECSLCGILPEIGKKLVVDHDHECCSGTETSCGSCVRGVICWQCNGQLVAGYEALPSELRTWPWLNEYLQRRPIRDMRNNAASAA